MDLTEEKIINLLRNITDPKLPKNIVEMGMVREVGVEDDELYVHLDSRNLGNEILEAVSSRIRNFFSDIPEVSKVHVQISQPAAQGQSHEKKKIPGIQSILAVASGKGGVGKSTVAVNLAGAFLKMGLRVGILDADIYGPNIPLMMGISCDQRPEVSAGEMILPIKAHGMQVMSMGVLVPPDQPMIWRGPMLHSAVMQFLFQVEWGNLDCLVVDMPPGTGDVQLTFVQSVDLSGAIVVSTPQEVALMDLRKAVMMFKKTNVPVLGVLENMSGEVFGTGGGAAAAKTFDIPFLGSIPLDAGVRISGDAGSPVVLTDPQGHAARAFTVAAEYLKGKI